MELFFEFAIWMMYLVLGRLFVEVLLSTYHLVKLARQQHQPGQDYVDRAITGDLVLLTVEVDHNQYLCYNAVTQEFVCQGADLTQIAQNFRARFPDKTVAIFNGNTAAVETLHLQFKTKHENLNLQ
jgi:hypothetical protein